MPLGPRVRANNVLGTIDDNPLATGAVIMNSILLSNMPTVSSAHAVVTLDPLRQYGNPEIVIITAHSVSATNATITRGAYGTTARTHPQGTVWIHAPMNEDVVPILTSSTRPADPYRGEMIFETDTNTYTSRTMTDTWITSIPLSQWTMGAWLDWTPNVAQLATAVTATIFRAKYFMAGKLVVFFGDVSCNSNGSAGGNLKILNLPVNAATATSIYCVGTFIDSSGAGGGDAFPFIGEGQGLNAIGLRDTTVADVYLGVAGSAFTAALANGDRIIFNGMYESA